MRPIIIMLFSIKKLNLFLFILFATNVAIIFKIKMSNIKNIEAFQELVRIIDATTNNIDHDGMITGLSTIHYVMSLIEREKIKEAVGNDFYNFVKRQISECFLKETNTMKANVREQVKKILMYPNSGYPPWEEVSIPENVLNDLKTKLSLLFSQFVLKIIDGKVYAIPFIEPETKEGEEEHKDCRLSETDYRNFILVNLKDHLEENCRLNGSDYSKLTVNPEPPHVTIINSNIVSDCNIDEVKTFVSNFHKPFQIEFGKIKTTISNDWPLFSRCYVTEIKSDTLNYFIKQFNEKFKDKLKKPIVISTHITFAIIHRSLGLF
jgi:hypothetical protein